VPCVVIDKERNKIILNPYARDPSDLFERDFDKATSPAKYYLPLLNNLVVVFFKGKGLSTSQP